jgi:WD40 repeat protein
MVLYSPFTLAALQVSKEPTQELRYTEEVHDIVFSPDGQWLAALNNDNTINLWKVKSGQLHRTLRKHQDWISTIIFSKDSTLLASGSDDKTVALWEVASGRLLHRSWHGDEVKTIDISPDGKWLASGGDDSTVKLWETETGWIRHTLRSHHGRVSLVAFSPNGRWLASISKDNMIKLWNPESGLLLDSLQHEDRLSAFTFSPDGQWLASKEGDDRVKLWETESWQLKYTLSGGSSLLFSPDSLWLATQGNNMIKGWRVASGELGYSIQEESPYWLNHFAFSPDSAWIAFSNDYEVKLWEIAKKQLYLTLQRHQGKINAIAFSPDGQWLASAGRDPVIKMWALTGYSPKKEKKLAVESADLANSPHAITLSSLPALLSAYRTQKRIYQNQNNQLRRVEQKLADLVAFRQTSIDLAESKKPLADGKLEEKRTYAYSHLEQIQQEVAALEKQVVTEKETLKQLDEQLNHLRKRLAEARFRELKKQFEQEKVVVVRAEVNCESRATLALCKEQAERAAQRSAAYQGITVLLGISELTQLADDTATLTEIKRQLRQEVKGLVLKYQVLDNGFSKQDAYFYRIRATVKGQVPDTLREQFLKTTP